MQNPAHQQFDREEIEPRLTGLAYIYAPVLVLLGWVLRFAANRTGRLYFEQPMSDDGSLPPIKDNRQLRRAQASCLRRARKFMLKWQRPVNPARYTPRAFAHLSYIAAMPKHWTMAQFMEN
ncbi:MAG: hypothetical protein ACSHXY_07125 [Alphaproteobacteria bacterium]